MTQFVVRRLLGLLFVLFGVSLLTFAIAQLVPVDPAASALGGQAREGQIQAYREQLGLDRPVWEQYLRYMGRLVQGDLGQSIRTRRPVVSDLKDFFPATFELSLAALVVSVVFGIPLGIVAALNRSKWGDVLARALALVGGSLPIFYVGGLGLSLFYRYLRWVPGGGRLTTTMKAPTDITGLFTLDALLTGNWPVFRDATWHLILPALTLGYFSTAVLLRITRSAILETMLQDFVRTARAKGLPNRLVILRHVFTNSLPSILTTLGITFGSLLSGAVLTETIFNWPGIGRYITTSVLNLDLPAVMGVTLLIAFVYPTLNTLVDIAYSVVDPRMRTQ